jgi:hypothetical protein
VVVSGSAVAVVSSLGSGVCEDSPAEKEDGAVDSSMPACSACCEQPIKETAKTAAINKVLAFLIHISRLS